VAIKWLPGDIELYNVLFFNEKGKRKGEQLSYVDIVE